MPEEITDLKSVHFDAPSLEDAVMQVLKADEGEEQVVLFNVPLNRVRSCGFDETINIPNNQRIRLVISPLTCNRFDMVVAFLPQEDGCMLPKLESTPAAGKAAAAKASGLAGTPWRDFSIIPGNRLNYGFASACILLLGVCALAVASTSYMVTKAGPITIIIQDKTTSNPAIENPVPQVELQTEPVKSRVVEKSDTQRYDVTVGFKNGNIVTEGQSTVFEADNFACPAAKTHNEKAASWWLNAATEVGLEDKQVTPNRKGLQDEEPLTRGSDSGTMRRTKLGALEFVRVSVDNTSPSGMEDLQILHSSFVRVATELSKWKVVNANETAVIKLRFEPDKRCLGVVFAEIRDNGADPMADMVDCRACQGEIMNQCLQTHLND